jgi:hypothetical protein
VEIFDTPLTILNYNSQCMALSLFYTVYLQFTTKALSLFGLLSLHQFSGTGFERRTFPFLCSGNVPVPQSRQLTVHYCTVWSSTNNYSSGALFNNCSLLFYSTCVHNSEANPIKSTIHSTPSLRLPAKRFFYQIPSVIVAFVILVFKV